MGIKERVGENIPGLERIAYAKAWPQPGRDPGEQWETSGVFEEKSDIIWFVLQKDQ